MVAAIAIAILFLIDLNSSGCPGPTNCTRRADFSYLQSLTSLIATVDPDHSATLIGSDSHFPRRIRGQTRHTCQASRQPRWRRAAPRCDSNENRILDYQTLPSTPRGLLRHSTERQA